MLDPDIYKDSPAPFTTFLSIALKTLFLRIFHVFVFMVIMELHCNKSSFSPDYGKTRVKYIADLGALAKTNPILAITFAITMFSYVKIPPLAGFVENSICSLLIWVVGLLPSPVGVVTSVIGRWAAERFPRVSLRDQRQFSVHQTSTFPFYDWFIKN
uniref:NADH:quinone oxidoreductase/Mrp antiporter transmembrane domain-containing protein n=1 Tax=Solanum lycopersicum TaxID=4081 RepID=K4CE31_SOLLC